MYLAKCMSQGGEAQIIVYKSLISTMKIDYSTLVGHNINIAVKSVQLLTEIDDDDTIYYYQNQPGHEF